MTQMVFMLVALVLHDQALVTVQGRLCIITSSIYMGDMGMQMEVSILLNT